MLEWSEGRKDKIIGEYENTSSVSSQSVGRKTDVSDSSSSLTRKDELSPTKKSEESEQLAMHNITCV